MRAKLLGRIICEQFIKAMKMYIKKITNLVAKKEITEEIRITRCKM